MFKDTEEQSLIYDQIINTNNNLLINARAGSGKTTLIVNAVKQIHEHDPTGTVLIIAFNKHIKNEVAAKVEKYPNVTVSTSYGIGWGAVNRRYNRKKAPIELNDIKMKKIVNKLIKKWDLTNVKNYETYKEQMIKLVGLAKVTLVNKPAQLLSLAKKHLIPFKIDDIYRALQVLENSVNDTVMFDYNDMVFLPATDNKMFFFRYDYVFVDEVQDLNRAQLAIVKKVLNRNDENEITGKVYYVGDVYQTIYGFNGADTGIFDAIKAQHPNIVEMPLTTSFRCSKEVIKEAQSLVLDIKAMDTATDGSVSEGSVIEDTIPGDFVLSRTMRPLLKLFFQLLLKKKQVSIKGIDFKETLIGLFKKHDNPVKLLISLSSSLDSIKKELAEIGITDFEASNQYVYYSDLKYAVEVILAFGKTTDQCIEYCEKIFAEKPDSIILSTIHRVKGLEADRVFILTNCDKSSRGGLDWMKQEEDNLRYVAITRAKQHLIYDNVWTDK